MLWARLGKKFWWGRPPVEWIAGPNSEQTGWLLRWSGTATLPPSLWKWADSVVSCESCEGSDDNVGSMEQDGGRTDGIAAGLPRDFITLSQPRPGDTRRLNEYIETPLRPQLPAPKGASKSRLKEDATASDLCQRPITAQPTAKQGVKTATAAAESAVPENDGHNDSIICRQCRRCKCEACRGPRHLPSKWICNDKCLCSGAATVDYCSCMCCVRGLFYHWAKDYEMDTDVSCADQPCSCSPHKRILRWCCLGLLAFPLPCLCCYWPLRGCLSICEGCYSKCTGHGCRCAPPRTQEQAAPEKRLLDSNSDCWSKQ